MSGVVIMHIEEALVSHIKANGISRIYPLVLPQKVSYPAVTYQKIAGTFEHSMGGDSGFSYPDYQFVCFAKTYHEAKETAKTLRLCLQNLRIMVDDIYIQAVLIENEIDDYEEDTEIYSVILEFRVFFQNQI